MSDDHTVQLSTYFPVTVEAEAGILYPGTLRFIGSFRIGRGEDCEVRCISRSVSRIHVDVLFEGGQWWVQDHHSRNGVFIGQEKVERVRLQDSCSIQLGKDGPTLSLHIENLLNNTDHVVPRIRSDDLSIEEDSLIKDSPSLRNLQQGPFKETPLLDSELQASPMQPPPSLQEEENLSDVGHGERAIPNLKELDNQGFPTPEEPLCPSAEAEGSVPSEQGVKSFRFGRRTSQESATQIFRKVLRDDPAAEAGPSTVVIRAALKEAFQQRSRRYQMFVGVIGVLALFLGGVAWVQYLKVEGMKDSASDLFYSMKTMKLSLSQLESLVVDQLSPDKLQDILARREQLKTMEKKYEEFLGKLGLYSSSMNEADREIMKMARLFGECEIGMPSDFVQTVKSYIQKWQSTDRLPKAVQFAQSRGYGRKVSRIMLEQHMPPQFFYLGLQESNFNTQAVGPPTRFGIAKGPWQFIPSTASDFGLQTGPLVAYQKYDPGDERHNFQKATKAAAKYLKHIYTTEAQASGLLVMASYNWGQTRVRKLIRQLPENPRERNFWELLKRFTIPRETYDYVFYIFSAAVIGENPALFGFSFSNPLEAQTR